MPFSLKSVRVHAVRKMQAVLPQIYIYACGTVEMHDDDTAPVTQNTHRSKIHCTKMLPRGVGAPYTYHEKNTAA